MNRNIQISIENWKKLVRLRANLDAKDFNEVIERLLKIVTKFKLAEEIRDVKI